MTPRAGNEHVEWRAVGTRERYGAWEGHWHRGEPDEWQLKVLARSNAEVYVETRTVTTLISNAARRRVEP